jgi:hypothetical protein
VCPDPVQDKLGVPKLCLKQAGLWGGKLCK